MQHVHIQVGTGCLPGTLLLLLLLRYCSTAPAGSRRHLPDCLNYIIALRDQRTLAYVMRMPERTLREPAGASVRGSGA